MVRTRFAPSPTGYLHIGGVRTALFNWLFSRRHGGCFILRVDDTDRQRNVEAALAPILEGFRWLGLLWDEGPEMGGDYGPYRQSQRLDRYQAAVTRLLDEGCAYYDYATTDEMAAERQAASTAGKNFTYSRRWMAATAAERRAFETEGRRGVVRLKMPRQGACHFSDLVRGGMTFEWSREADHVIQRADGSCLYHLASVVDDHEMRISHVIRAEEHLSNTPRQIFIARSLGYEPPIHAHLPYVAEPGSKHKLSKRKLSKYLKNPDFSRLNDHGQAIAEAMGMEVAADAFNPVVVDFYRLIGYRPEALVNYLLLLGWSLDDRREMFSRDEMVELFSLERVRPSPASFDPKKLTAFQARYMHGLSLPEKIEMAAPYLQRAGLVSQPLSSEVRRKLGEVIKAADDRLVVAGEILEYRHFFMPDAAMPVDEKAFEKRIARPPEAAGLLRGFRERLSGCSSFEPPVLEQVMRSQAAAENMKMGQIVHAVRVALTGQTVGFGLFHVLAILGRDRCVARLDRALERLAARHPAGGAVAEEAAPRPEPSNEMERGDRLDPGREPLAAAGKNQPAQAASGNFIETMVVADLKAGRNGGVLRTRFPPEPNGFLHIGHAKSICLNFGLAARHKGRCNLRFDDTNPSREESVYVEAIQEDLRWLGFDGGAGPFYASDYFQQLHHQAVRLIKMGKAYVDDLDAGQIRAYRGTLTEPGRESPHRSRCVEENLDLFERMRGGEFPDGSKVLRAKIDMAAGNLNMRDPVMYRILRAPHHRTGQTWCIYPMYDWAHGLCDSMEGITHSLCTLEFEDHRPLYDWFLEQLDLFRPRQIEFARLNLSRTVLSKRKLGRLVTEGLVSGWDDPRMPTLSGLRRRGYTPGSIKRFCDTIGLAKVNSTVDVAVLEHCLREELNRKAQRVMAVLRPLKVVLENYPEEQTETLDAVNNPEDAGAGTRKVPFSRTLYIETTDFMEDPPRKYFRLAPGREVRLRYGYFIRCEQAVKDPATGQVVELRCSYDPATRGGAAPDGRKVRGTIHWVSARHALPATVRLYDHLLRSSEPETSSGDNQDFTARLNPDSLRVLDDCQVEPFIKDAPRGDHLQFERQGYFCVDVDSQPGALVFNRTVSLRDTWAKIEKSVRRSQNTSRS